ncbi:MAG: formate-dependent phosphoribosylglycinamide formyltransferase [Gammaproteobacteria bacterium]|nr:formate-dependent phosphoribosylglycinamide formyltransferase [Gammaproteobacteria bacterium]MYF03414.1 formate-dependent phosphoribosylglycinamide formyltransferase [Gammaproteobacteria bacterium]MYI78267.1 formate-dependent phosphoribosylglycinamide formyltransferase [Gammaproteobacteria bacterium]
MVQIGTPLSPRAKRVMLLGSGELGKEVVIELQRLGVETVAVDRYDDAPAMQVAHRSHTMDMRDSQRLAELVKDETPDFIVPEIEAIATDALVSLEEQGFRVVPSARAAHMTMNRERIRSLAAQELGVPVCDFRFASNRDEFLEAVEQVGLPCVVKPTMSSSGKGQSTIRKNEQLESAWEYALGGTRGTADQVIVEELIDFDYEITLLTIRHVDGTAFCEPIGHRQEGGDYQESWQPHPMAQSVLNRCQKIATQVTDSLGGLGLFGVEFFVKDETVWFSELSPRPHDTGMVTMISQDLSEFALHVRAFLGLPIPEIEFFGPSASAVISVHGDSNQVVYGNLDQALVQPQTEIRLFGKPQVRGERRMGVALSRSDSLDKAKDSAKKASGLIRTKL